MQQNFQGLHLHQIFREMVLARATENIDRAKINRVDEAHPPKPKKLDETQVAFLIATACFNPPSGRVRWTMQLLADHLVSVGIIDSISDETVRQTGRTHLKYT